MNNLMRLMFHGRPITQITYQDRPAWVAREVGAALEYASDGKGLIDKITSDWGEELIEGQDYIKLVGEELTAFKAMMSLSGESPLSRAPHVILLFESGYHGALLLTRQPLGKAMRRWLREQVLPQLARDGRYDPTRQVTTTGEIQPAPAAPPPAGRDELTDLRQRLDLAQGLIDRLPEARRATATEAMLRLVLPGLDLPEPTSAPVGDIRTRARAILMEARHVIKSNSLLEEEHDINRETFRVVRAELEEAGAIPALATLLTWDGKNHPAKKPHAPTPAELRATASPPAEAQAALAAPELVSSLDTDQVELLRIWVGEQKIPFYTTLAVRLLFAKGVNPPKPMIEAIKETIKAFGYVRVLERKPSGMKVYRWYPAGHPKARILAELPSAPPDWEAVSASFTLPWTSDQVEMDRLYWEEVVARTGRQRPGQLSLARRWGWKGKEARNRLVAWDWNQG